MNKRLLLKLISLGGLINSVWMLILHMRYDKFGGICAVDEKISCEVLTYKQYSEWFGVPTPLYALFVFLILFILTFRGWKKISKNQVTEDAYVWVLYTLSLFAAIGMAYISFFILKKLCPFCFIFYVLIVAGWFLSKKILKSHGSSASSIAWRECSSFYKNKWVWITMVAFVCVIALGHQMLQTKSSLTGENVSIRGDEIKTSGNPGAPISLVVFSDFQCPHCKTGAKILREIEMKYPAKVKVTYKFFPLDPSCNDAAQYGQHLMACDAAKAAVCAGQQGKFWRFHDHLFENQESMYERKYYEYAEIEGMDIPKFSACLRSEEAMAVVKKDTQEGAELNIEATPTIFINGKKYKGKITVADLENVISTL